MSVEFASEWTIVTQVSSAELAIILLYIASYVDLKKYKKNPEQAEKTTDGEKSIQRSPSCVDG